MFAIAGGIILGFLGIVVIVRAMQRRKLRKSERDRLPHGIPSMSKCQLNGRVEAKSEWKSGAEYLGEILLRQYFPEDRPLVTDEELAILTKAVRPNLHKFMEPWIVIYVTWLLRLFSRAKYGEEFSRSIMANVYGRIATNEQHVPAIIADGIKYWFKELDHAAEVAATNTTKVAGQQLPLPYFIALRFLSLQGPYASDPNPKFDGVDIEVASVFAEAQDIARPNIDFWIEEAGHLPH